MKTTTEISGDRINIDTAEEGNRITGMSVADAKALIRQLRFACSAVESKKALEAANAGGSIRSIRGGCMGVDPDQFLGSWMSQDDPKAPVFIEHEVVPGHRVG